MVIMKLKDVISILESNKDTEVNEWLKAKSKGCSIYSFCKATGFRVSEYRIRKRTLEIERFRVRVLAGKFV